MVKRRHAAALDMPPMTASDDPAPTYCTCLALRRATRRVTQIYDAHMKPLGLRITQFAILGQLAGEAGGGARVSITALAHRLDLDRSTLGRNIRPLLKSKLVLMDSGADRRAHTLTLSESGRALFEQAVPLWRQAQRHVSEKMGREKTRALRAMLDETVAILGGR